MSEFGLEHQGVPQAEFTYSANFHGCNEQRDITLKGHRVNHGDNYGGHLPCTGLTLWYLFTGRFFVSDESLLGRWQN
jgi:hypothetical protein